MTLHHQHSQACEHTPTGVLFLWDGNLPFCVSLAARCDDMDVPIHTALAVEATSVEEAEDKALAMARMRWPAGNGWRQHSAVVVPMGVPRPSA